MHDVYIRLMVNFTLILPLKKIEMTIADVNYITQYQLNVGYIKEGNTTFWYRADLSLH